MLTLFLILAFPSIFFLGVLVGAAIAQPEELSDVELVFLLSECQAELEKRREVLG
jgi:hypothetical protein